MPTICELKIQAKKGGYRGYSKLKKAELEKLLAKPPASKAPVSRKAPTPKAPTPKAPTPKAPTPKAPSPVKKSQVAEIEALLKKNPVKLSKEDKDLFKTPERYSAREARKIYTPMLLPQAVSRQVQDLVAKSGLSPKEAFKNVAKAEKKMISAFWKQYGGLAKKRFLDVYKKDWESFRGENFSKYL